MLVKSFQGIGLRGIETQPTWQREREVIILPCRLVGKCEVWTGHLMKNWSDDLTSCVQIRTGYFLCHHCNLLPVIISRESVVMQWVFDDSARCTVAHTDYTTVSLIEQNVAPSLSLQVITIQAFYLNREYYECSNLTHVMSGPKIQMII